MFTHMFPIYDLGTSRCLSVSLSWHTTQRTRGGQGEAGLVNIGAMELVAIAPAPVGKKQSDKLADSFRRELQTTRGKRRILRLAATRRPTGSICSTVLLRWPTQSLLILASSSIVCSTRNEIFQDWLTWSQDDHASYHKPHTWWSEHETISWKYTNLLAIIMMWG